MTYLPPDSPPMSQQPPPASFDQWAASMMLVVQAMQRLHAAFDEKFVHSKSSP